MSSATDRVSCSSYFVAGAAGIPAGGADGAPGIAGAPPGVFRGPGIDEAGAPPFMRLLEEPPLPEK